MFQWDNALIYLGVTAFAAAGVQPSLGIPILYFYVFVAVFGSGLAVGIRWWQGHLDTAVARVIAFIAGMFGSGLVSPWFMHKFDMAGLDALMIIGLSSMIAARIIVFITAKMDVEKIGGAGTDRLAKIINPNKKTPQVHEYPERHEYPDRPERHEYPDRPRSYGGYDRDRDRGREYDRPRGGGYPRDDEYPEER